jgi:hypothetical protein
MRSYPRALDVSTGWKSTAITAGLRAYAGPPCGVPSSARLMPVLSSVGACVVNRPYTILAFVPVTSQAGDGSINLLHNRLAPLG